MADDRRRLKDKDVSLGGPEEQLGVKKQTDILKQKRNWTFTF